MTACDLVNSYRIYLKVHVVLRNKLIRVVFCGHQALKIDRKQTSGHIRSATKVICDTEGAARMRSGLSPQNSSTDSFESCRWDFSRIILLSIPLPFRQYFSSNPTFISSTFYINPASILLKVILTNPASISAIYFSSIPRAPN